MGFLPGVGVKGWAVDRVADAAFDYADDDDDGYVSGLEAKVTIMVVQNHYNKYFIGWQDPPSKSRMKEVTRHLDHDKNGKITKEDFRAHARNVMQPTVAKGLATRFVRGMAINAVALPLVTGALQNIPGAGFLRHVPIHMLAPLVGGVLETANGLFIKNRK